MRAYVTLYVLLAVGAHAGVFARSGRAEVPAKVTYAEHVRPIFQQHCFACHGQDTQKSDLALNDYDAAMIGGAGGEVLFAGDLESSRLWALVNHEDSPKMPPEQDKIPAEHRALIKAWIEGGLLKDAGSKAKPQATGLAQKIEPTADNRPVGEPAMPEAVLQEPVVYTPRPAAVDAAAASPWAPLVAIGGPRQVTLYHAQSGELLGILPYTEGKPHALRFSRDGSLLLVGGGRDGASGNVALFDVKAGARLATLGEETDAVLAADVSPDHGLVALGGPKKTVRVYRIADGSLAYEIDKHTDWITGIEFSPNGELLATADRGGGFYLWDARRGLERADLRGHQEMITDLSWRLDSAVLASASDDDTVRVWQADGKQLKSWTAHGGGALSVDFSREGQIVTAGRDKLVRLWQGDGKHVRDLAKFDDAALIARFTHDGAAVVAGNLLGQAKTLAIADGQPLVGFAPNPPTLAMRLAAAEAALDSASHAASAAQANVEAADVALAAAKKAHAAAKAKLTAAVDARQAADEARAKIQAALDAYRRMKAQFTQFERAEQLRQEHAAPATASAE